MVSDIFIILIVSFVGIIALVGAIDMLRQINKLKDKY